MAIRKRLSEKVAVHEDNAIRIALRYAIQRQGELLKDLDHTSDDDQDEINKGKARIQVWERWLRLSHLEISKGKNIAV